ncbi:fimbria/pilus outer membrane usher protein [Enterobacter asburiae]|nr:fimbrial biogenesis outer membrane usher protein [Enterobacter asburiae]
MLSETTEHPSGVIEQTKNMSEKTPDVVYLDVYLNGVPRGFHPFNVKDERVFVNVDVLKDIGLTQTTNDNNPVNLTERKDITTEFNPHLQLIKLVSDDSNTTLDRKVYGISDQFMPAEMSGGGGVLNYQLLHNTDKHKSTAGMYSEFRGINNAAIFSNSMVNIFNYSDDKQIITTRLDTNLTSSWQKTNVSLQAGDTFTDILPWTRAFRFGGIKISNTASLSPGKTNAAPLELEYTPKAPSEVDLLLDGSTAFRQRIPGGPFTLQTLPPQNGFSNAELWVTDRQTGEKTLISKPVYFSADQLKAGAAEWSVGTGFYRSQYGIKSNVYDDELLFSGNLRYGFNRNITLESHTEMAKTLKNAGAGVALLPHPYLGTLTWNYSFSDDEGYTGKRSAATHQWNNSSFYLKFSWENSSEGFKDISALYGNQTARRSIVASMGTGTAKYGFYSVSHIDTMTHSEENYQTLSLSWQKGIADLLSLYFIHRMTKGSRNDASYFTGVSIPLGSTHASFNTRYTDGSLFHGLSINDNSWDESGFAWKGQLRSASGYKSADGDIEYRGSHATFTGNASTEGTMSLGMAGSLAYLNNTLHAGRPVDDAFASVSTSGIAGVPVYVDNRLAGITDSSGYLFLPQLSSYQQNKISIDTLGLPAGYEFSDIEKVIVPADRSGNSITFDIKHARAAVLVLTDHQGGYLPAGTVLKMNSAGEEFIVGFEGEAYVTDINEDNTFVAHLADAGEGVPGTCRGKFTYQSDNSDAVAHTRVRCL